ncbi:translation initiation factor IF-2 [Yersinia ruckeri]|uniref:Gp138 family membrane-puncturing spike protein n=1 Tax=Yersinia ruckeri TaxID=29486 RepID=UPI001F4035EA|nr:Gp138 family membrane-puncturing spike protein [Yersinia ruckeri]EKN4689854.1 translation initiation factor IF-2 [Yersinia ruckeri]EKN4704249.1 translation initiation factor IF-2 [Yersinia ruckeri]ELI6453535.1 translation initiation factor IF-2 [Yersinia ruckeri]MCW6584386.1 translation initiation factor IF-2 [Yersinia ruckeri]MCW6600812.1 translation initiation factor IF-2 [Yersinia ruckeri]
MTVSTDSRSGELAETLRTLQSSVSSQLRVSMPGIVQSFDADSVTCDIQIGIKGESGGESTNLSVLTNVPVVFPRGGGVTMTFPIKPGDECLLVFGDRCIDFWHQSGDIQETVDERQHDLSDAFAIIGPQSQAKKISGISTSAAQLRSDDGSTYFEINPTTKKIKIVAPGGLEVLTPKAEFSAEVLVNGLFTFLGGLVGSAAAGVSAKITGAIEFVGTLTSNGKTIDDTHTHNEVQPGTGNSGKVN